MSKKLNDYLKNKSILILGFGREGKSSYDYLRKNLPDKKISIADAEFKEIQDEKVNFIFSKNFGKIINDYDLVIKSPGISLKNVCVETDITCQTDLFLRFANCKKIGITGTKGKTTCSSLLYRIFVVAGKKAVLMGNMGIPVLDFIDNVDEKTFAIMEISSHQLQFCKCSPNIALITNIYEEHLDHYLDFSKYVLAKWNIAKYQTENDVLITNENQGLPNFIPIDSLKAKRIEVGVDIYKYDDFYKDLFNINNNLIGIHNRHNIFYCATIARLENIKKDDIAKAIEQFEGIPHRMEYVATNKNIDFYNDSIATIPNAVMFAIQALEKVDTLIFGGMDRGIDYEDFILNLAESKIKNFICMPDTGYKIGKILQEVHDKNVYFEETMDLAVKRAYEVTKKDKICLFSPAAPSYNRYKDFEEKGNDFKICILKYGK